MSTSEGRSSVTHRNIMLASLKNRSGPEVRRQIAGDIGSSEVGEVVQCSSLLLSTRNFVRKTVMSDVKPRRSRNQRLRDRTGYCIRTRSWISLAVTGADPSRTKASIACWPLFITFDSLSFRQHGASRKVVNTKLTLVLQFKHPDFVLGVLARIRLLASIIQD